MIQGGTNSADRAVHTNGNYRLLWDARADLDYVIYSNMVVRTFSENAEDLTSALGADVDGRVTVKFKANGTASVVGEFVAGYDEKKQKHTTVKASGSATLVPMGAENVSIFIYLTPKGRAPHVRCLDVSW